MNPADVLPGYVARYCQEYHLPFNDEECRKAGENPPRGCVLPMRVRNVLYSFQVGLHAAEAREFLVIRVPVMEVPVGKILLPLYRRLLEINDELADIRFSVDSATVFLGCIRLLAGDFGYPAFRDILNRIFDTLSEQGEFLHMEFASRSRPAGRKSR